MKKKISLTVLLIMIVASLMTGTYAVYTKSIPFVGTITKVSSQIPPAPEESEDIVNNPGGIKDPDVSVGEDGTVSITKRGDFLHLVELPGNDYKVEVDISNYKAVNAYGIFVDGYYHEAENIIYAETVQFVSGHLEIRHRKFSRKYDAEGNIIIVEEGEDTYSLLASAEDVASVYSSSEIANGMHVSVIMKTKIGKKGTLVVVPEVYINEKLVPNQVYPEREILHTGNKAYIGYRSWWGGVPDIVFKNLKVLPLESDMPNPEIPDVIIPEAGGSDNPDITVDPGSGSVTIKNAGDYVYPVDGITSDSYVISSFIQVNVDAPGNLQDHLKGFGIYIDGTALATKEVVTDCVYFTNNGTSNSLQMSSYSLVPVLVNEEWRYDRISLQDDKKVTTQGEIGLQWNEAKNGFYLLVAVKGDPLTGKKQIRIFVADKHMGKFREASQYYDTPWTGLPPTHPFYKKSDRIFVGYHSDNNDGRSILYKDMTVTNGLDRIPAEIRNNYDW